MTNEEKAVKLALERYPERLTPDREFDLYENDRHIFIQGAIEMAEWKDEQFDWHERMHDMAIKQNLTNKEFREILEKMPDNALVCVECCNPKAMVYDEKYNLIRID